MALQLPARIGKYDLEEFLGGGMSHVYRARDTVIGRTVAVKILTDEGCANVEAKARFLQEARMAGNLQHDNVISIYDFGEDDQKRPYMVMEFLRGEDLRHAIRSNHTGDLCSRLRIALQIARAIGFIHSQQIVHRDVKPENIHIMPAGIVKLMDFGIAKAEGLSMTRTGYVMGTPYYMAPEQVLGKNITEKVDVYAFGVLFFELLAGVRPVTGDTVERIFYSILNEPLNLEPLEQGGVPLSVRDLIAQCTAKDPGQRPETFEAVARQIEWIIAQLETMAPTVPVTPAARAATVLASKPAPDGSAAPATAVVAAAPPARRWVAVLLGAGLLAVVAAAAALFMLRNRPAETVRQTPAPAPLSPTRSTATGMMVLIPPGPFRFGKDLRSVTLPAFYIDQTEVSNSAYQRFCQETGHPLPRDFPAGKPDYPVVNVTIGEARQFVKWAGKRLPTSQEWEKAARGTEGWPFPWGAERDPSRANVRDNQTLPEHSVMPVRSFDNGASPFHVLQMVGNVWEFVDDSVPAAAGGAPRAYIRGQSYREALGDAVMYDGVPVATDWKERNIGFRCVEDPPAPAR
jgi:serine/threonine-protein kinase